MTPPPLDQPDWIADDPETIGRVAAFLARHTGMPFCDACLAEKLAVPITQIRPAIRALTRRGNTEHGLWWCSECSSKAYVTVAFPGGAASADD